MPSEVHSVNISLEPADNPRLANLCGPLNGHLHQLEKRLGVEINNRGNAFSISGEARATNAAVEVLKELYDSTKDQILSSSDVHLHLQESELANIAEQNLKSSLRTVHTKRGAIKPRGFNQQRYVQLIEESDLVFGIGPAGTGKTYLCRRMRRSGTGTGQDPQARPGETRRGSRRKAGIPARRSSPEDRPVLEAHV